MLKSYRTTLQGELQHCSRASQRHRKRVTDQFQEFEVHEGKLVGWGLKFIIPFFRMQVSVWLTIQLINSVNYSVIVASFCHIWKYKIVNFAVVIHRLGVASADPH